jgi:hypothetical protein
MHWSELRQGVLAKLRNARNELQDVWNMSAPAARYDPAILRDATRQKVSVMVDDLNRILKEVAGSQ